MTENIREPQLQLFIGDSDVIDLVKQLNWDTAPEGNQIVSRLHTQLSQSANTLFPVDLRSNVTLDAGYEGESLVRQFSGLIEAASPNADKNYCLDAKDMSVRLEEFRTGGAFGSEFTTAEVIYMLTSAAEGVNVDPGLIHGLKLVESRRAFVFISPLPGVSIQGENPIRIADIELYVPANGMRYDDELIAEGSPQPVPSELTSAVTRALVPVQACGFLEAMETGLLRLRRAIDWLSFRTGLGTPCYQVDDEWRFVHWNRKDGFACLAESNWIYVRDSLPMNAKERYWLRWLPPQIRNSAVDLSGEGDPRASQTLELFESVLLKNEAELTPHERSLLLALHFHRRARQTNDLSDALVNYWSALEFLLGGFQPQKMFAEGEIKQVLMLALQAFKCEEKNDCEMVRPKRERIKSVLSEINNLPLRTRWRFLCETWGLRLSQPDEDFMWNRMRRSRNDLQHGRTSQKFTWIELDHFGCIVEKAILVAARAIHDSSSC